MAKKLRSVQRKEKALKRIDCYLLKVLIENEIKDWKNTYNEKLKNLMLC